MTINTSYAEQDRAFAGMLADIKKKQADTYVQGEASAEMRFGIVVGEGTASAVANQPDDAILMADANTKMAGITVHAHNYAKPVALGDTGVKINNLMTVLKKGRIYAICEGAVTKGNYAYVRHTTGAGGSVKGALRADADTASAVVNKGIVFAETKAGVGDGLVLVDVDMSVYRGSL